MSAPAREGTSLSSCVIQRLDDDLINKIAAGEVVERPASVVKELVENAIDAGATRVVVSLRDGGKKSIQIRDNGCGMSPDDLVLAVSRHATSKIKSFDDLSLLHTKGFRGEALASIASVSQMALASCREGFEPTEIRVHGGELLGQRSCAQERGTTVSVKYLFYQTPARLKFLRSKETETSHCVDVITKLALSHSQIAFELWSEDRCVLNVPVFTDPLDRLCAILGSEWREALYPFSGEGAGKRVQGYVAHPQRAISQRNHAYFFVNQRAVTDKVLWHAVMEAHRDLLMKGRYPVLVLHLEVDPQTLDVNVHPAKSEVRFHHPQEIHAFVHAVVRECLQKAPWNESSIPLTFAGQPEALLRDKDFSPAASRPELSRAQVLAEWGQKYANSSAAIMSNPVSSEPQSLKSTETQSRLRFGKTAYAHMTPIGQLHATYILCESEGKLILIDQHAAHERIGFEKLMLQYREGSIPSQTLLVPQSFDLKPSDVAILQNYLESLSRFGVEIDYFGGNTFVLKALPTLFRGQMDLQSVIADVLADIRETSELVALKDRLHHVLATMACHAQIRAHHRLTLEEMQALLRELEEYQFTDFCPHGRPVAVEVGREEIEKWFRRIL